MCLIFLVTRLKCVYLSCRLVKYISKIDNTVKMFNQLIFKNEKPNKKTRHEYILRFNECDWIIPTE